MQKTYLIFGASSDTAVSYINRLDSRGENIRVIAFCHSSPERFSEMELKNIRLAPVVCDLRDSAAVEQKVSEICESGEPVTHFLHFAAGGLVYDKAANFSAQRLNENFSIQVTSAASALKYLLPKMKKQKFGRVVLMTSSCTIGTPPKYMTEYTAVKYALVGLIKSYAVEYFGKNVTVNGIAPAMMDTRFWDTVSPHIKELNKSIQPKKECITPEQIGACLDYLCSEEAAFVTGENINLSGGQTI